MTIDDVVTVTTVYINLGSKNLPSVSLTRLRQLRHRGTCKVNLFVLGFSIISSIHPETYIMFYFVILCVGVKKLDVCNVPTSYRKYNWCFRFLWHLYCIILKIYFYYFNIELYFITYLPITRSLNFGLLEFK